MKKQMYPRTLSRLAARLTASITAITLFLPHSLAGAAIKEPPATREEVCAALIAAADDYNPGVTAADILRGDANGDLQEDEFVTRLEALLMLERAFGDLPEPVGDNERKGYRSAFTDIPAWAQTELKDILKTGIVVGTSETTLSPNQPITMTQLNTFIHRTYALFGSNEKDDFYATVNKQWLDTSTIQPGKVSSGTLYDMMNDTQPISELIQKAVHKPTTEEEKRIAALYTNVLDWDARNALGITPIKPYLERIDAAQSLNDLMAVQQSLSDDLNISLLMNFGLSGDANDSSHYTVGFSTFSPSLNKDIYAKDEGGQKEAYLTYLQKILTLCDYDEQTANANAQRFWEIEKSLAPSKLSPQEQSDVDIAYNIYTMQQLKDLFPHVDLDAVYQQSGLARSDNQIIVSEVKLLEAVAALCDDAHLEDLRLIARVSLIGGMAGYLSRDFEMAKEAYQKEFLGVEGRTSDEENATQIVQNLLGDELGRMYAATYFSPEAKADVENMVREFIAIYKDKIRALDWMSDITKTRAIEKLDAMGIKVGYPDEGKWNDLLKGVTLKTKDEGGSYFDNIVTILKAQKELTIRWQSEPVNKDLWAMNVFTVNACYVPTNNEILFPAGILQAPFYDINASQEQNLGGIGYIIAHEITHAFDNNGAKFDKDGNATDWWTEEDYAAFQALCNEAIAYYDGVEAAPGIPCNGALTLSENIADLGAASCILAAAKRLPNPDLITMFRSMTQTWASTMTRETALYYTTIDVHAPDKLRGMLPLQSLPEFYETFDIQPGDGMYLPPEDRVTVW